MIVGKLYDISIKEFMVGDGLSIWMSNRYDEW